MSRDSFEVKDTIRIGGREIGFWSLARFAERGFDVERLPWSLRILLENLLRNEDGIAVEPADVEALAGWDPGAEPSHEIAFRPARVLLQDFTGVPALVDLAAMRDAMGEMGGDPSKINPLIPAELVIDHSVQVDAYGREAAFLINAEREYERNRERYAFLRWGQTAFDDFKVVPPDTGIVHQVNLEYLARVVFGLEGGVAYPDTLVGTDSHTTMVNGLGVLGWGVGGIEAEAAMLGQPISMLIPHVVGFRLHGSLPEGATATDLVLRVTEMLRAKGVVAKFVEFYGPGIASLSLADRATIGNMSPEYGATCAIFPVDAETLAYLRFTGRDAARVELVEAYMKAQGLFHTPDYPDAEYSDSLELDLASVEPSIAGPKLPQRRIPLTEARETFEGDLVETFGRPGPDLRASAKAVHRWEAEGGPPTGSVVTAPPPPCVEVHLESETPDGEPIDFTLRHGSVVIAAITSCTNTSNPSVMVGAGLLARNAVARGLTAKPWVKTSLAPGSMVVTEYLEEAGLMDDLEALGFHLVGYGCTTCIGNSGPLRPEISRTIEEHDLVACSVLSGNRNFEGRINPDTRANYLASPPLVVAYALAGRMDIDLLDEPLGQGKDGEDVYLKDIWPSLEEVRDTIRKAVKTEQFTSKYAGIYDGDERWHALSIPEGDRFDWPADSTYIRRPTFLTCVLVDPPAMTDIEEARVLAMLGDSVTTDHISPAGSIKKDSPAGRYLIEHGVEPRDFNSYGSRRGNHEIMVRGTFANIRLRNLLAPGTEGGFTRHLPDGETMSIYDAAMKYADEGVPLLVITGKEYGSGSSRDWAAKGTVMLGVRAVVAESYERIHRSNLIGMGVLPLQFEPGDSRESLGLTGEETYAVRGIADGLDLGSTVEIVARAADGSEKSFRAIARIDTPVELEYYRHGGILPYVLRQIRGR
ncbi:MAG TPA: aconitate hydratase AcnA [Gemmatimonadota bacterium]|jgi:aconitate hydratase|nr:aconitate hydratase AcnA [Gemmatimonadota bacterium]